jgi:hypothetical protein
MDASTKDSVSNILTLGGLGMTMADITSWVSLLVLCSALVLNVQRIYTFFKNKKQK